MVVSSRKVIFYNSEADKAKADPSLILDLSKLFHVRSVTQGDVIRADTKEIPRIFQLLYAGEGESRKPTQNSNELQMLKEVRATLFVIFFFQSFLMQKLFFSLSQTIQ